LRVPLLVHVAPHLFVGFGPTLEYDFQRNVTDGDLPARDNPRTTVGLALTVGGWL
jgi:hypothetical protein